MDPLASQGTRSATTSRSLEFLYRTVKVWQNADLYVEIFQNLLSLLHYWTGLVETRGQILLGSIEELQCAKIKTADRVRWGTSPIHRPCLRTHPETPGVGCWSPNIVSKGAQLPFSSIALGENETLRNKEVHNLQNLDRFPWPGPTNAKSHHLLKLTLNFTHNHRAPMNHPRDAAVIGPCLPSIADSIGALGRPVRVRTPRTFEASIDVSSQDMSAWDRNRYTHYELWCIP